MSERGRDAVAVPRFSIIVPVFKVQGFLRECLDSVLTQDHTDFEVIAVDDCSPDRSGAILDEYAARDDRVRVLHLPENVGLGRARNTALEKVRGEYILFLDSDDTLVPGALGALAERLAATADPEILIFDYARTYWDGSVRRNRLSGLLDESGEPVFPLADRPQLLDLLQIVCNKAYRRDFIEKHGFAFPSGYYEDAPWTFCALITAQRIALLDRVCLHYRQRRQGGNILRTTSRKHFDVFGQYARVFDYLDAHPELSRWRPHMFGKMIDHYLTILDKPGRLPQNAKAEFFHRAARDYRERVPAGFVRPTGVTGGKYTMLAKDAYPALAGLKIAGKVQRRVRKHAGKRVRQAKKKAVNLRYQALLRQPLDENLAVYSAYWDRLPSCNPLAIYEKAKELAPGVHGVWVVKQSLADQVPAGIDHVVVNSPRYWEVVARAKYFINNVNFADAVVKREGQIHLQTHHGTPLKSMGTDQKRYPAAAKGMSFGKLLTRADRWDFSLSSNQHATEQWERVYPCDFASLDAGYPRNDVYYRATAQDILEIRERLGITPGKTAVLYAPTMRDYQVGYVPRLDLEKISRELGDDFVLLVRTHYFYGENSRLQELQERGTLIDVSGHPVVEELCLAADALITDYSSIMFDYANLDRPIINYADDWDTYRRSRGVTFHLLSGKPGDTPGVIATTEDELIDAFRSGRWDDERATELRAAFRDRFCQWDDGHAAERVVRRVFLGQEATPEVLPKNQRTVAPSPRTAAATTGLTKLPTPRTAGDDGVSEAGVTGTAGVSG
ncbi:bifunctional glycosyltransferase/CDP-glycerol:glycerophosphate glycerophosphotransferase [Streptomyces halobius]|uniref:Bifunctional glycosyltransferase family 2 protein/CDP-glycerol:glycerophosphate glycerophosphotransferase n=1 Tax=Streptomyces halobius TaxID=2879846 RepID=A0ABY4MBH6_9ACTN|nr:bifunctional glycosyltransferase family 2 protein/CDP-glycerol:glycerophosphate glycerophosphotransferase [Streptomyces halobius]UQA95136.1 bifunctional glycosyltransferase family 2 protein/CDP-glycerol:glycerophosphate glycerophosphotransferase [Streptomyces halobius]